MEKLKNNKDFLKKQLKKLEELEIPILQKIHDKEPNLNMLKIAVQLGEINLAISQIKKYPDCYGLCWKCREKINNELLEINPIEQYCPTCKEHYKK